MLAINSCMHVKHRLVEWRKRKELSQRDAAKLANVSQAAWQSYENDLSESCPGINAALVIAEITKGEIAVEDWRQLDVAKAIRRERTAAKRVKRTRRAAA